MGYVFFFLILVITVLLIPFSSAAALGASEGLKLFGTAVFPSLFPFMVCADAMIRSGCISRIRLRNRLPLYLFYSIVCCICGTPSSALICRAEFNKYPLSAGRLSALCAVINQPCPVFVVSAFAAGLLGDIRYAVPFTISVYAPPLIFSVALGIGRSSERIEHCADCTAGFDLPLSVSNAVTASLRVGGTIVFFKTICSVTDASGLFSGLSYTAKAVLTGLVEMTNGLSMLSDNTTRLSLAISAFLLSFGGCCIFFQTKMLFPELKPSVYFIAKLAEGLVSGALLWTILPLFTIAVPTFSSLGLGEALSKRSFENGISLACVLIPAAFSIAVTALAAKLSAKKHEPHALRLK